MRLISDSNAQALPEDRSHPDATAPQAVDWVQDAFRDLEGDIDDLARMLRAADHLQYSGDEDLERSARLLYDKAVEMAGNLNRKYQNSFLGNRLAGEGAR
jgi:hypothetical protein